MTCAIMMRSSLSLKFITAGDGNVYFFDGPTLIADIKDNGTVDYAHPSDSGFASMARAITPVLGRFMKK